MTYQVGIDVGTTFTAAAVHRDGVARVFSLSESRVVAPTMVAEDDAGQLLVGWSAARQLREHPERVVHSFKRRIGDRTPISLGARSYEPSWYMAQLIGAVITEVTRREGDAPSRVALTHPASWNAHKMARLLRAASTAGLKPDATVLLSEPEAAAVAYTTTAEIADGALIAVYDLGGGSFDTAVLRRAGTGYEIVGLPEGIERLGGLDFDAALYRYATDQLARSLPTVDPSDEAATRALSQLHLQCVVAKEALSFERSSELSLSVGERSATVTIERPSFEALIRPALMETIGALRRCLATARISTNDVAEVLLTGGSSRIPLVAHLLSEEMGRPVAVHQAPKELVAVGAAYAAARADGITDAKPAQFTAGPTPFTIEPTCGETTSSTTNGSSVFTAPVSTSSNGGHDPHRVTSSVAVPREHALSPDPASAAAAPVGSGRPPSLLRHEPPSSSGVNGTGGMNKAATNRAHRRGRSMIVESFGDAPLSLVIGVLGALAFVLVLVVLLALFAQLGSS